MAGRGGGRRPPQEIPLVLQGRRLLAGLWIPLLYVFNFIYAMFVNICTSKSTFVLLLYCMEEKGVEATVDGVLGGYGHVNEPDIKGSEAFLNSILAERFPDAGRGRRLVALGTLSLSLSLKNVITYFDKLNVLFFSLDIQFWFFFGLV